MEHRNISLFRGYSDTESVETSLEEIVNIIKCDAALRDRTEKHRYYLQQDLRRDADREKSGCSCFAVAVCFEGGKTRYLIQFLPQILLVASIGLAGFTKKENI